MSGNGSGRLPQQGREGYTSPPKTGQNGKRPVPCDTKENESNNNKKHKTMIIMPVKEGENIERALKKFKRKYERTGVLKELRRRQYFTKPSVAKREAMQHAIYVEHMYRDEE